MKIFNILFYLFIIKGTIQAQTAEDIEGMELNYKECLQAKIDTSNCGKTFLRQMDSVLTVVSEKVRMHLSAKEKAGYLKEQQGWLEKKDAFNKKQDENFVYNLKEGTWGPNMIWLVYENKAVFVKKRAETLAKRLE